MADIRAVEKSWVGVLAGFLLAAAVKFKSFLWLGGSLLTMLLSILIFAQRWGLPYAISLVMLLLIHESGHWIWMRALGFNPRAPMFIPGFGAFVAMTKLPPYQSQHAWVALAGPLIGGVGCAAIFALGVFTKNGWLMASAQTGFFLNLLQMVPAKPFDGGFVLEAISKWFLIPGTVGLFVLAAFLQQGVLFLIAIISLLSWLRPRRRVERAVANRSAAASGTEKAEAQIEVVPATGWERVAIAFAYLSLVGALAFGMVLSSGDPGQG